MENFMNFARENFYYILGAFVIFILFIVIIISCSTPNKETSYDTIENKMIEAAKEYYSEHKSKLPKTEDETKRVSLSYLVNNDFIKEVKDPKNKEKLCKGSVEVTKRAKSYNYQAFLECTGYKTEFLVDVIKKHTKTDENGNGLYETNNTYVYKGDNVKNYVKFNDELWRILLIDNEGDIKIMHDSGTEDYYIWDDRFNVKTGESTGINDFNRSRLKQSLQKYYKTNFNNVEGVKEKIIKKDWCIGSRKITDPINNTAECSQKTSMYVGLITASDFYTSTLDTTCTKFLQEQCRNYNYLSEYESAFWTLTGMKERTDRVYGISYGEISDTYAENERRIMPVIYLDTKVITKGGNGTKSNPFIVK